MRIRQIALIARDLEKTVRTLEEQLGIEVSFRDPGVEVFGLVNAVFPVGNTFLEVVSPEKDDTAGRRYLARRGGDSGYMVMLQTRDLAADRARIAEAGIRTAWEIELDDARAVHLHPKDTGGAILSFDEMAEWDAWRWAGRDWPDHVRTDTVRAIAGVEIEAAQPERLAEIWAKAIGTDAHTRDGGFEIRLDAGHVRFVPGASDEGAVCAIDLEIANPAAWNDVEICGVRFRANQD